MSLWKKSSKEIKDYLFPIYCLECGKEGDWVCQRCKKSLTPDGVFCCPVCHANVELGVTCPVCWPRSFLAAQISLAPFQEGRLPARIIESFKYHYAEELKEVLREMIGIFLEKYADIFSLVEEIAPVPLHPRRYAERGFNQAEEISQLLGQRLDKSVSNLLKRSRYTSQQAKLSRDERIKNVQGAFKSTVLPPRNVVLLVDDVFTTGATMQECARVLKENGAGKVIGFTVVRG